MNNWQIPLFKIYSNQKDVQRISEILRRGNYWATGPEIEEFERQLSEYLGVNYCIVLNSGTSALHAILAAYGIGSGDEVIVPSFTFIATANAPLFVGAKPVFADIEKVTLGLDPDRVREKISRRTRAIIPIHFGGSPCMIEELKKICDDNGLILIEDAAESLGARINKKRVGSIGEACILSFCQNKIITTGEGGAVATNSETVYQRLKLFCSHGRLESTSYFSTVHSQDYITLGYNFRMSSILAALGISQLRKIDYIIELRRNRAAAMTGKLLNVKGIIVPELPPEYYRVYQLFPVLIQDGKVLRDQLQEYLAKKGIMTKVYFEPVHLTKFYRDSFGYCGGELPVTEKISESILALPIYPSLTEEEINYITNSIFEFMSIKDSNWLQ